MGIHLYTFACLVLFFVLHKEVAGEIKVAPDSLPLKIISESEKIEEDNVQFADYLEEEGYYNIDPSKDYAVHIANFRVLTPKGEKIDHLEYPIELKLGETETTLKGTVPKIIDNNKLSSVENKDIEEGSDLYLQMVVNFKDANLVAGDKGTITVSVHGVDKNGKVVAPWGVTADAEVDKEDEE